MPKASEPERQSRDSLPFPILGEGGLVPDRLVPVPLVSGRLVTGMAMSYGRVRFPAGMSRAPVPNYPLHPLDADGQEPGTRFSAITPRITPKKRRPTDTAARVRQPLDPGL